jgi:prolyl 4-hydroxylase
MDSNYFKLIIPELLNKEDSQRFIDIGEVMGFELSKIRTKDGDVVRTDIRNNSRVILDDQELANSFFDLIKDKLPEEIDGYRLKGLNEQLKIYKYEPGEEFKLHKDAPYIRNDNERSFLTMLVYLNDGYEGGETFFTSGTVKGNTGDCVIFRQKLLHAGLKVTSGVKYAIRTDVMYCNND